MVGDKNGTIMLQNNTYEEDYVMSKVLVDNWQMEDLILDSIDDASSERISKTYGDILNAIVLWDELYYPQNSHCQAWHCYGIASKLNVADAIKPLNDNLFFAKESQEIYEKHFKKKASPMVAEGAIRYSLLSNSNDMGYLPSMKRAEFLDSIDIGTCEKMLKICRKNRTDSLEMLDKIIEEQFLELKSHLPMAKWNFQYPVLIDYIKYNCNDKSSYIDVALQIKKEKEVIRYRKYMDKFENDLEKGNWKEIIRFDKIMQEIVNDILKISERRSFTISGSISVVPSINISTDFVFSQKKYHLNFLRKLAKFSLDGKRKRI